MFWKRKDKKEPNDGRFEKRESIQKKSDAAEALMRAIKGNDYDRRREVVPDFSPERRTV